MSATAAQRARLRRMVDEPTTTTYDDDLVDDYIERFPVMDERGEVPYTWDTSTSPPTQDANEDWVPTYDINAAAADIWNEKAAQLAQDYDVKADGSDLKRAQAYAHMTERAEYYGARRVIGTIGQVISPDDLAVETPWIANLAEQDD